VLVAADSWPASADRAGSRNASAGVENCWALDGDLQQPPLLSSAEAMVGIEMASPPAGHRWRRSTSWQERQVGGALSPFCHPAEPFSSKGAIEAKSARYPGAKLQSGMGLLWEWGLARTQWYDTRRESARWPLSHPLPTARVPPTGSRRMGRAPAHWRGGLPSRSSPYHRLHLAHVHLPPASKGSPRCSRTRCALADWQTRAGHSQAGTG